MGLNAKDVLYKHGLRYTKQREALLSLLMDAEHPLSAEQCFNALSHDNHRMNLSTVYRILDQLSLEHILEKSYHSLQQGHVFSFVLGSHRHYLLCTKCHRMFPLDVCPMHGVIETIEKTYGFKINSHQLELTGLCQSCQS
jgi:Fur family ferric uptake transcriptional regulator